ncbi:MAG: hypothetical protein HOK41_14100, partial [Nitrospina sp.]|nr:hypothetical protein [Nitrospina sp.]
YAEKNNISFLNTSETLIKYIETIKEDNFNVSKLPYFRIDGHMSNKGSELVADAILELLANRAALRKNS